jgi:hypothetical protein
VQVNFNIFIYEEITMKINKLSLTLTGLCLLLLSQFASADAPSAYKEPDTDQHWTQIASACTVDEGSVNKYTANNTDITFKSGLVTEETASFDSYSYPYYPLTISRPIKVRCNIVQPMDVRNPSWNAFVVGYFDPDSSGVGAQVKARLIRVSRPAGEIEVIARFDSNTASTNTDTERHEELIPFNNPFDFRKNEYYVEFDVLRSDSNLNPSIYSLRLAVASSTPG